MSAPATPLLHVLPAADWEAHERAGADELRPVSLAREGFVHLSFPHQLAGTLARWFPGDGALVVLELDPARLADGLVLEPGRGGAPFPHLYRGIRRAEIVAAHAAERRDGRLVLAPRLRALQGG